MGSGSGFKNAATWVAAIIIVTLSFFIVVYIAKPDHPLSSFSSHFDCFSLPNEVAAATPSTRKMLMMMGVPSIARAARANNNNKEDYYSPDQSRHHYPNTAAAAANNNNNNQVAGVQLRNVPSGPDPLHHNGAPQRRPRPITP